MPPTFPTSGCGGTKGRFKAAAWLRLRYALLYYSLNRVLGAVSSCLHISVDLTETIVFSRFGEAIDIMGDPFTPSIGFVVSTAKFFAQLNAVKDETGVVLNQVKVVTNDVVEAERLYLIKRLYLSDGDQSRIEEVIKHTRLAVNRIAKEVEPARKSMKKIGTIDGFHRVDWILRKSASTETYQHSLETCHRSLLDRMSMLRGVQSDTGSHPTSMESSNASVEESLESDETGRH